MSEPTVTVIPSEGGAVSILKYSNGYQYSMYTKNIEPLRKALNELRRAEKASKSKKRYVACLGQDDYWYVRDRDTDSAIADFAAPGRCEGHARLFAKALNKQERERLACNTVAPGFTEI